jgi:hypothetical protein
MMPPASGASDPAPPHGPAVPADPVLAAERDYLRRSREFLRLMREYVPGLRALAGDRVSEEYLKADLSRRAEALREIPDIPLFFGRVDYAKGVVADPAAAAVALPVVIGLIAIVVYFQVRNSLFLSAGNLVNLMTQAAFIVTFGMAEVFVLLLGEIDLSLGYNAALGAVITLWMLSAGLPLWLAVPTGLAFSAAFAGSRASSSPG